MNRSPRPAPSEGPITPELLADLQAGLLDDATAARVRQRVRVDPEAADMLAALDRVRRDIAALGDDEDSAPAVPPDVSARLITAVRTADRTHARTHRVRRFGALAGACAAVLAVGVGVATLLRPDPPRAPTAQFGHITTAPRRHDIGLTEAQILALLTTPPDYGPLADDAGRIGCLASLGYPSGVRVLGARPLDVAGRHGVLILLPDDTPGQIVAMVVPADCNTGAEAPAGSGHPEVLAETVVRHPAAHT